jgi:hypothetical protein
MKSSLLILLLLSLALFSFAEPLEPIRKIEIGKNNEFKINGKPFFPIMGWLQKPDNFKHAAELNFNTFCGSDYPNEAKEVGCYVVTGFRKGQQENGYVLGWIYSDEPDNPSKENKLVPRQMPAGVDSTIKIIRSSEPKRLIFLTLTCSFMKEQSDYSKEWCQKNYPLYVKSPDVIGFDYYPIYGWGYPKRLNWVGSGVKQMREMAGKKPLYAWIETHRGSKWMPYQDQPEVLPQHTRNEVWQAIINGATAIGYFTHAWFPTFTTFSPSDEMQKELQRLNGQITRLAPAILADPYKGKIEMTLGDGLKCQFKATRYKRATYIFAQNIDLGPGTEKIKRYDPIIPVGGKAAFTMKGLKAGTQIEVVDENRTITAEKDKFTDDFASLAEHIYKIQK